jgi:ribosomal protein S17E
MQEGKREEAMNIVKVSDELKEKFWEIFTNYYIENKEKLDEHAKIF